MRLSDSRLGERRSVVSKEPGAELQIKRVLKLLETGQYAIPA